MEQFKIDTNKKQIIIIGFVSKAELDAFVDHCHLYDYTIGAESSQPEMRIVPIVDPVKTWPTPPFYPDIMYSSSPTVAHNDFKPDMNGNLTANPKEQIF